MTLLELRTPPQKFPKHTAGRSSKLTDLLVMDLFPWSGPRKNAVLKHRKAAPAPFCVCDRPGVRGEAQPDLPLLTHSTALPSLCFWADKLPSPEDVTELSSV